MSVIESTTVSSSKDIANSIQEGNQELNANLEGHLSSGSLNGCSKKSGRPVIEGYYKYNFYFKVPFNKYLTYQM